VQYPARKTMSALACTITDQVTKHRMRHHDQNDASFLQTLYACMTTPCVCNNQSLQPHAISASLGHNIVCCLFTCRTYCMFLLLYGTNGTWTCAVRISSYTNHSAPTITCAATEGPDLFRLSPAKSPYKHVEILPRSMSTYVKLCAHAYVAASYI
jgi:hypothetical protein